MSNPDPHSALRIRINELLRDILLARSGSFRTPAVMLGIKVAATAAFQRLRAEHEIEDYAYSASADATITWAATLPIGAVSGSVGLGSFECPGCGRCYREGDSGCRHQSAQCPMCQGYASKALAAIEGMAAFVEQLSHIPEIQPRGQCEAEGPTA